MDKLRSMEIFVGAVDTGSFSAAAERFGISAVMVGKHVQQLEQALGARLLARTTRRHTLTEIGAQYVEQCRQILAAVREAEAGAEALRSTPRGRLRISAPVSFGNAALTEAVCAYLVRHPEVSLDLDLSDRMVDVVEEGFDLAIRIGELDDSSLVARPLAPYKMVIVASPGYLRKHGKPKTPADLARHHCLDFSHWTRHVRWRLRGMDEAVSVPASRLRANQAAALRQAALAGFGIAMQAEMMLAEDLAAGRLVRLLDDYLPPPRPMHLLYARDRLMTPKLSTFIAFVLARFGPGSPAARPAPSPRPARAPRPRRPAGAGS
ncbi:LysR family transcriptional regulator [Massilia sp. TS11]|uniref:LysR family transcriptional regulator n=1 Tax=Massilia sp. TS11 TaxID=2908003 RepID=UPI001EDC0304|nr:LysR family transcriptional regulator [Massilia sp. TS11]MCG2582740.1 LysR family transcriptional regulator [Massilia sp. TS11]